MMLAVRALLFRRIYGPASVERGPVLYVGFHRDGAVDGWVYDIALRGRAEFLIAANLVKNPISRLFFSGIEVTRPGDGGAAASNRKGLTRAVSRLAEGGDLFVFPEGTSTLGPAHLPFQKGAAFIAAMALRSRPDLRVVPVTVRYGSPQLWGGEAEVLTGPPLDLEDAAKGGVDGIYAAMTEALEALDPDFASERPQEEAEALSALLPLPPARGLSCARRFLAGLDEGPRYRCGGCGGKGSRDALVSGAELWRQYREAARGCRTWRGAALFPKRGIVPEVLTFLASGACVAAAAALNAPAVLAGWWAGRHMPDGPNVVLLWKALAGLTVLLVAAPLLWGVLLLAGAPWAVAAHVIVTLLGCRLLDVMRRSGTRLWNFRFRRDTMPRVRPLEEALHDAVMAQYTDP